MQRLQKSKDIIRKAKENKANKKLKINWLKLLNPVIIEHLETSEKQIGKEIHQTEAEVSTAIKCLKASMAPGKNYIRPEILIGINILVVCWLTRVFQATWKTGKVPKQWQTDVLIPIYEKGYKEKSINYKEFSLLSLSGKVNAKCLEKRCRKTVESQLQESQQCGFCLGRSTID